MTAFCNLTSYTLHLFALPYFLTAAAALGVGAAVLIHERGTKVSGAFALIAFCFAGWFGGRGWMACATTPQIALWWARLASVGLVFLPTAIGLFTVVVLRQYQRFRLVVFIGAGISVALAPAALFGRWLIHHVVDTWWGPQPVFGWLGRPFLLCVGLIWLASLLFFGLSARRAPPHTTHRQRLQALLIALAIAAGCLVDFPAMLGILIYPVGSLFVLTFLVQAAQAVWRYRLLDITPGFAAEQVLTTLTEALIVLDKDGVIRVVNQAACRLFGKRESELLGNRLGRLHANVVSDYQRERLLGGAAAVNYQINLPSAKGVALVLDISASALQDRAGRPVGVVCIARDVTEKKQARAALRMSEEQYHEMIQAVVDYAIIRLDVEGRLQTWNQGAERIYGYHEEEILTQAFSRFYTPLDRERELPEKHFEQARREGRVEYSGWRVRKDGSQFWGDVIITALYDGVRHFHGFSTVTRDITERRKAEQRQAIQYAVARVVAESAALDEALPKIVRAICESGEWDFGALWVVDAASQTLRQAKGWHAPSIAVPQFEAASQQAQFASGEGFPGRVWAAGQPTGLADVTQDLNAPRAAAAKQEGIHGACGFPIHIRGKIIGVMEFLSRDVRPPDDDLLHTLEPVGIQIGQFMERKQAEAQLTEANVELATREQALSAALTDLKKSHEDLKTAQMHLIEAAKLETVGRLAAGVAHEVKNPLAVILLGLEYLSKRVPADADGTIAGVLKDLEAAVKKADMVIKGLLDYSSLKQLTLTLNDFNVVIEKSVVLVRQSFTKHNITLHQELGANLPPLKYDSNKLEQVFVNVFMNAVDAIKDDGALTVRTYAKALAEEDVRWLQRDAGHWTAGARVVVAEVDDTGEGIPEASLNKIFDPFYTTKPTGKGTGLGLSVTRSIIDLHKGMIDIRNKPGGGGVRATVWLRVDGEEAS